MISDNLKSKVFIRVEHFMKLASVIYARDFPMPVVYFDVKGGFAGKAKSSENIISFNAVLLAENEKHFMEDTIPHEIAHVLCYAIHGWIRSAQGGISHHGTEWKAIMRALGCVPSRCHDLDVSNVKRKMRSFSYFCPDCKACFTLSAIRHNRAVKGTAYKHKNCTTTIEFIEEIK
jgi:SprT protein